MKTIDLVNTGEFRELLNLRKIGVDKNRIIKYSDNSVHLLKGINSKNELMIQAIFWTFPKVKLELNKILASNHHPLYSYRYRYLTDPFNAGAGTGSTNIQNQASWAAARGGTTATQLLASPIVLSWRVSAGSWYLIRAHIPFLTSALSESANVTGLNLKLYRTGDFVNTDTCTLHVVPSTKLILQQIL